MLHIPPPDIQVNFSYLLEEIRSQYLQNALMETVADMDIREIDKEIATVVPAPYIALLASRGLRSELVFALPCILEKSPRLLGYYRLLLGHSQKTFYATGTGLSVFKPVEQRGQFSDKNRELIPALCNALIRNACLLLDGLNADSITPTFLDDLTLLTLGPQLRGSANVVRGMAGIMTVFESIEEIVRHASVNTTTSCIELSNAAKRKVLIEFSSDPDIRIREQMTSGEFRNIIAIEVKAGRDFSNIHNRLGEAEKSHQKARNLEYNECWTVVNVDRIDIATARKESPSTNRFYLISDLQRKTGDEYNDFESRIISLTSIPEKKRKPQKPKKK